MRGGWLPSCCWLAPPGWLLRTAGCLALPRGLLGWLLCTAVCLALLRSLLGRG